MRRRQLIAAGLSMPMALAANRLLAASPAASGPATAFDDDTVPALARALAARAYAAPSTVLPAWLADISYDQYRDIRFRGDHALWHDDGLRFQAQFFHRGFLFKEGVTMHVVEGGRSRELPYRSADFEFGPSLHPSGDDAALGFAGFRLHAPLNRPDYFDELCVFLGASYFRAVAPGLAYGLSARGLALGSGDPGAEEFPRFSQFWLETPAASADHVVVHALLDSPSVAGAFRFDIRPGEVVAFDVDARLYPRKPLPNAGIAALTSMYEFDAGDRVGTDDFRPAVHDSDGLSLINGAGEQVWRPLRNPAQVEHSGFRDRNPRGFGLMQRKRAFVDFQDPEASYEKRPSAWVEPVGDWGAGEVHLVEIPTGDEYLDNIVAFWRPDAPLAPGREHRFRYRLRWGAGHAWLPALAQVVATRAGAGHEGRRLYVVDLDGGALAKLPADAAPVVDTATSAGSLHNAVAYRLANGHWRMSFELAPGEARIAELRARLLDAAGRPLSETWLSRWSA